VFDEAFSQLDLATKAMVLVRLKRYVKQKKRTAIFVLHDPLDAFYLADAVLVLHAGSIVQKDSIEAVYNNSASSQVAKLFGPINKMSLLRAKRLFPSVWQNFNQEKRQVWFRPHMAKRTDLAIEFKVVNELFYGKTTLLQLKADGQEIWLED
jgi:ABC-type sulfate/molybdate transport systems ATPase subunit